MKIFKFTIIFLLLLWVFEAQLLSQFHVNSKVELTVKIENGHPDPPDKVVLIGKGDNNRKTYSVNINPFGIKKYTIYNVEAGKFLLAFNSHEWGSVCMEVQILTLYDAETQIFRRESFVRNGIEVQPDRNLKLDLVFKTHDRNSGFSKKMEKKFKDFDYVKLTYCTSLSSLAASAELFGQEETMLFASNGMTEMHGPAIQDSDGGGSQNNTPVCSGGSTCGSNSGSCRVDVNRECKRDGGYIKITIGAAYFQNTWLGPVNAGTQVGDTVIGVQDSNGLWPCGVTSLQFRALIEEGTGAPVDWPKTQVTYSCDTEAEKCKFEFTYYVGLTMKTTVWNATEMCTNVRGYQGRQVDGGRTCNCQCYYEAAIEHESTHCESYITSVPRDLANFCSSISQAYQTQTCCNDKECQTQSESLKWAIFGELTNFVSNVGSSPEGPSDTAEARYFRRCVIVHNCRR